MSEYNTLEELYQEDIYNIPPRTTIIIPTPWHELTEGDISLLTRILASVKLTLATIQVRFLRNVNIENLEAADVKRVVIFGSQLTPDIEPYKYTLISGIPVIKADAISSLDDLKKKQLWVALREMFSI